VDIGCGMMAVQTDLNAGDLPDSLHGIRTAIEEAVPHGHTNHGGRGEKGSCREIPSAIGMPGAKNLRPAATPFWKNIPSSIAGIIRIA
jgi:hypothetical protein